MFSLSVSVCLFNCISPFLYFMLKSWRVLLNAQQWFTVLTRLRRSQLLIATLQRHFTCHASQFNQWNVNATDDADDDDDAYAGETKFISWSGTINKRKLEKNFICVKSDRRSAAASNFSKFVLKTWKQTDDNYLFLILSFFSVVRNLAFSLTAIIQVFLV